MPATWMAMGLKNSDEIAAGEAARKALAPREWTRTIDRTGNNRLLYQLSYRGIRPLTMPVFQKKLNIFRVLGLSIG
jgi:hypothetical protein